MNKPYRTIGTNCVAANVTAIVTAIVATLVATLVATIVSAIRTAVFKKIPAALLAISTATLAAGAPTPTDLERPGVHGALDLAGCNRAMHFSVSRLEVADRIDDRPAPAGHRWLVVQLEIENRMPADLMFDLDYREELLVASVARQTFLLVNGDVVARSSPSLNTLDDSFILPHIGATQSGTVVYPVPEDGIESLSLRYYHDQYAPVTVSLAGPDSVRADTPPTDVQRNDVLELGVAEHSRESSWQGRSAPEGMQWLVVELLGRSRWTLEADALALDREAEIDARVQLPKAMEYVEAAGLLQVVVDGRHGYPRELSLGSLPAEPPLLHEVWAGGRAVFPVPIDAGHIELAVHFPQFRGEGIEDGTPEAMRFELFDEPAAGPAPPEAMVIDDDPTPLTIHRARLIEAFADHQPDDDRALLQLDASMRNTSDTGGMMAVSERLSLAGPDGEAIELLGAYLHGALILKEPFWLPAGGQPRAFSLIYDVPDGLSTVELDYGGVSVNASEQLHLEQP
ncbi:MAG: hypothetical protein WD397_08840 [Wenzhouxiangellaceae bacterium]